MFRTKPFKSTIDQQFWEEIKSLKDSHSIQKIVDYMFNTHNLTVGYSSVRKLVKHFDLEGLEQIPPVHPTKPLPIGADIQIIRSQLLEISQTALKDKNNELFFKAADRLISIYKIDKQSETIETIAEHDYGKSVFQNEIKRLIKPIPKAENG